MKNNKCFWSFLILLVPALVAGKQIVPRTSDLHREIQQVYNFQPHTLSDAEITEKSALLDKFWKKAETQRELYVPGLRRELADFSNPPFFLFDGSQLLVSLSNQPMDRKIILSAVAHSDLRDVQPKDYFLLVHRMAAQGEDTTRAAFKILAVPKFTVFIPQHVLTLGQNYCLIYLLMPTDPKFWLQPAIDPLSTESDATAQQSLLLLLWYAQTSESVQALVDSSVHPDKPQASIAYATQLIHRKDSLDSKKVETPASVSEQSLRQARQVRLKAVSDEALYDLDDDTLKIVAKRR